MTPEIIATYVTLLTTNIISPVISWKLAKKKIKVDTKNKIKKIINNYAIYVEKLERFIVDLIIS